MTPIQRAQAVLDAAALVSLTVFMTALFVWSAALVGV